MTGSPEHNAIHFDFSCTHDFGTSASWHRPRTQAAAMGKGAGKGAGKGGKADDAVVGLRQRPQVAGAGAAASAGALLKDVRATKDAPLAKLESEDHICVDGTVYELGEFAKSHPGGDSIGVFGGADCTVHYYMIHPTHERGGERLARRMKVVGKLEGWEPRYSWGSAFEKEVKAAVLKAVPLTEHFDKPEFFLRAALFLGAFFALAYTWATTGSSVMLAVALGCVQASIGLAVQHDANHGAASRNPKVNALLGFGADLIGGCKYLWMEQHWTHHAYTNDHHLDPDADSADPMVLFHDSPPDAGMRKWWSPFQHILLLPVLSFYWLTSVFNPQIITLRHSSPATETALKMDNAYFVAARPFAWAFRCSYIAAMVVSPFFHAPFLTAAGHVLLMGSVESLYLASLFALSHNFEGAERYPQPEDAAVAVAKGLAVTKGTCVSYRSTTNLPSIAVIFLTDTSSRG